MQSRPDARRRLILANLEHTASSLDLGPDAPPDDEGAREPNAEAKGIVTKPCLHRSAYCLYLKPTREVPPATWPFNNCKDGSHAH